MIHMEGTATQTFYLGWAFVCFLYYDRKQATFGYFLKPDFLDVTNQKLQQRKRCETCFSRNGINIPKQNSIIPCY